MKTVSIEIPEDLFVLLEKIALEIQTQDNRATAKPYFFQIRDKDRIYGLGDGYEEGVEWVNDDHESCFDVNDMDEMLEWLGECGTSFSIKKFKTDSDYREEIMEEAGFRKVGYKDYFVYKNAFLTESQAQFHLQTKKHHYSKNAVTYVEYAANNPEMITILQFFEVLAQQTEKKEAA